MCMIEREWCLSMRVCLCEIEKKRERVQTVSDYH